MLNVIAKYFLKTVYKSILATEKGWLFASSRIFVKGDSNIRASGGVSGKYMEQVT